MDWTWDRLREVLRREELSRDEFAVGARGGHLAHDRGAQSHMVELVVTRDTLDHLKDAGWISTGKDSARHPTERGLTAHTFSDEYHAYDASLPELLEQADRVDEILVIPQRLHRKPPPINRFTFTVPLVCVLGTLLLYGATIAFDRQGPGTMARHLAFQTTKVEATVEGYSRAGRCTSADIERAGPGKEDITVRLSWVKAGTEYRASFNDCGASTKSPQQVWVTDAGEVASQRSPFLAHLWPLVVLVGIPFYVLVGGPLWERWRRRRAAAST